MGKGISLQGGGGLIIFLFHHQSQVGLNLISILLLVTISLVLPISQLLSQAFGVLELRYPLACLVNLSARLKSIGIWKSQV
jgi:hypothetical protein